MGNISTSEGHINDSENRSGNQEWTIKRNEKHWAHNTLDEDQNKKQQKINNTAENYNEEQHGPIKILKWGQVSGNDRVVGM